MMTNKTKNSTHYVVATTMHKHTHLTLIRDDIGEFSGYLLP